jgi:acyl-coenzyme A thioesterase PaaI-like protein
MSAERPATTPPAGAGPPARHPDAPSPGSWRRPHHDVCFGCGDAHPAGLHLRVLIGDELSVHAELVVTDRHQGGPGRAHGGVLAAALDEVLGAAGELVDTSLVTARLECDYLKPVPLGESLHLSAECIAVDGRKIYAQGEGRLGSPDGALAVRAAALFMRVPADRP